MAYTKTNLNETTETVAVDMTAEDIENNETTETVAEQNARGYSKTVWNESTPITADKLNKMETGIANGIDKTEQIMEIPITNSMGWQQFRWTRPNCNTISWTRDAEQSKAIEIYNETTRNRLLLLDDNGILNTYGSIILPNSTNGQIRQTLTTGVATPTLYITSNNNLRVGSADIENVCIYSKTNPKTSVAGSTYTLYHTGNKPTAGDIGALPLSGGALTGSINVSGESKFHNGTYTDPWHGEICSIKASGNVGIGGSLKVNGRAYSPIFEASTDFVANRYGFITYFSNNQNGTIIHCEKNNSAIRLPDNKMVYANPHGNLEIGPQNPYHCHFHTDRPSFHFNKELLVNGSTVWHTGNFNPATKLDAGAFTIHDRDLRVHGKRAMVGFNTADGDYLEINYDRDFAAGVRIKGLLGTDSIKSHGNLAFSNYGNDGGLNANIHNLALHSATGNGQMMTVGSHNTIYVGNPNTPLILESNIGIVANIGGTQQRILTDRDSCHRFSWTGSRISIDGGGNNAAVNLADISELTRALHNWHTGQNLRLRADGGLGPLDGYITMTW